MCRRDKIKRTRQVKSSFHHTKASPHDPRLHTAHAFVTPPQAKRPHIKEQGQGMCTLVVVVVKGLCASQMEGQRGVLVVLLLPPRLMGLLLLLPSSTCQNKQHTTTTGATARTHTHTAKVLVCTPGAGPSNGHA